MVKTLVYNKNVFIKAAAAFAAAVMTISAFSGCSVRKADNNEKLKVYTSFYPMYDLTKKTAGDKAEVINLVPAGTEPHDWEPTPRDMQAVADADILVYNGLGMEQWIDKVNASVGGEGPMLVEASEGIEVISENNGGNEDTDPHVWTSIGNAVKEMENIKNALCEADSENAAYYEDNFNKYKAEFEKLDNEFREFTENAEKRDIIVAHEAFSYLCRDYGLNQIAVNGLSAEDEPSPARMTEIIDYARQNNIKYVFAEELSSQKTAETVAKEIGAEIIVLNPLEGLSQEEEDNGDDYLSVMKRNLEAIKTALE